MAKINLLPWRDEFRQEKQKEFLTVLAAVAIFAVLGVYIWISSINSAIGVPEPAQSDVEV